MGFSVNLTLSFHLVGFFDYSGNPNPHHYYDPSHCNLSYAVVRNCVHWNNLFMPLVVAGNS